METAAVPTPVESVAPNAVVAVLDGPTQDRSANRERTPPPPAGSRAKAIAKMSSAELAGPRKGPCQAKGRSIGDGVSPPACRARWHFRRRVLADGSCDLR